MSTVFDGEQWNWRRAYKSKTYPGGLINEVAISDTGARQLSPVFVEVPSEFFTLFVANHPDQTLEFVDLFAEFWEENWVFGYQLRNGDVVDLWSYKELPDWLNPRIENDPG